MTYTLGHDNVKRFWEVNICLSQDRIRERHEYMEKNPVFQIHRNLSPRHRMDFVFVGRLPRGAFSEWIRISMSELTRKSIDTNLVAPVFFIDPMTKRLRKRGSTGVALTPTTRKTDTSLAEGRENHYSSPRPSSYRRPREEADTQHIPVITIPDPHPHHTHCRPDTWRSIREVLSQTRRALLSNARIIFGWYQLPDNLMQMPARRHRHVPSKRHDTVCWPQWSTTSMDALSFHVNNRTQNVCVMSNQTGTKVT